MDLQVVRDDPEVIWGAERIAKLIGLSKRQVFHLLETGQLKGPVKVGGRWCITRQNLFANFHPSPASPDAFGQQSAVHGLLGTHRHQE